jgi:hypothetical protein
MNDNNQKKLNAEGFELGTSWVRITYRNTIRFTTHVNVQTILYTCIREVRDLHRVSVPANLTCFFFGHFSVPPDEYRDCYLTRAATASFQIRLELQPLQLEQHRYITLGISNSHLVWSVLRFSDILTACYIDHALRSPVGEVA